MILFHAPSSGASESALPISSSISSAWARKCRASAVAWVEAGGARCPLAVCRGWGGPLSARIVRVALLAARFDILIGFLPCLADSLLDLLQFRIGGLLRLLSRRGGCGKKKTETKSDVINEVSAFHY